MIRAEIKGVLWGTKRSEQTYAFKGVLDGFDHTYNFPIAHNELVTLDLATGETTKITDIDPSIGVIFGAASVTSR